MPPKKKLTESQIVRLGQTELLSQLKAWGAKFDPKASLLRLRVVLLDAIQEGTVLSAHILVGLQHGFGRHACFARRSRRWLCQKQGE